MSRLNKHQRSPGPRCRTDEETRTVLLARRVFATNGCWIWPGRTSEQGEGKSYGRIQYRGKPVSVHRLVWLLFVGAIPEGQEVCHRCDDPLCYNFEKCLFLGTHKENMIDAVVKGRHARAGGRKKVIYVTS